MFKKKKPAEVAPLYVFRVNGVLEDSEVHIVATYNVTSDLIPIVKSWRDTSWWNRLKLRIALFFNPINTLRVLLSLHSRDMSELIQAEYVRLKSDQKHTMMQSNLL